MEPWMGSWAPWCVGSVFAAPQLLTGASSAPLGPLMFEGIGMPQRLLSTGCSLLYFDSPVLNVYEQKVDFLSISQDAFFPEDLLDELLQEDNSLKKGLVAQSSQILGNRLQTVECRDGEYSVFFPTGKNADRIGGALCSRDGDNKWHVSAGASSLPAKHTSWSSFSMRQPIFQLSAVRKDPWDADCGCLVAARSLYRVQFLTADREVEFRNPMAARFEKHVSHVAWNPHMQGEAAVVLEKGEVLLFDLQRGWSAQGLSEKASYQVPLPSNSTTSLSETAMRSKRPGAKDPMHKKKKKPPIRNPFEWWQCEYAWHPKTLLVAGSRQVYFMDFRGKHGHVAPQPGCPSTSTDHITQSFNTSIVAKIPGVGTTAGYCNLADSSDLFLSFARGDHDGMYEFCTVTRKHLFLFDTRRPQTPVLQWVHGMEAEPPGLLAMCPIPLSSRQSSSPASEGGKVILAASLLSGNIQAFCYGPHPTPSFPVQGDLAFTSKPSHLDERLYAWDLPSRVLASQAAPNDWATILASTMNIFQQEHCGRVSTRESKDHISGLVILPHDSKQAFEVGIRDKEYVTCRGFSLMQLTGEGDILAQHFRAAEGVHTVGTQVSLVETSNAAPSGIKRRSRRCNVPKLAAFLNYIRTGSGIPKIDISKPGEDNLEPAILFKDKLSNDQQAVIPVSPWKEAFSTQILSMEKHGGLEVDISSLLNLHKDFDPVILMALIMEALQQSKTPLSVYEIAHAVMRRYLPADLQKLAAGMPADARLHSSQNYLSMLLSTQVREGSFLQNKIESPELAIPLPLLLQSYSLRERGKKQLDYQQITEPISGQKQLFLMNWEASSMIGHGIFQNGCDYVQRAIYHLTEEMNSRELVPDLSLGDSVEVWRNTPVATGGADRHRVVHYRSLGKEIIAQHRKPIRGQSLITAFSRDDQKEKRGTDCSSGNLSGEEGKQTSVLERDAFCLFLGSTADVYGDLSETREVLEDSHLCPIQLPFLLSSEGSSKSTAISSLRAQFKQWQQSFLPYQSFCQNSLRRL